jgi:hypothetical protein
LSALWRTAAWQETVRWFRVDIFSFFSFLDFDGYVQTSQFKSKVLRSGVNFAAHPAVRP